MHMIALGKRGNQAIGEDVEAPAVYGFQLVAERSERRGLA